MNVQPVAGQAEQADGNCSSGGGHANYHWQRTYDFANATCRDIISAHVMNESRVEPFSTRRKIERKMI
jgi:hypothetical protein